MRVTAEHVIGSLVAHRCCTDCGGSYARDDIQLLCRRGSAVWELAAVCRSCRTVSLIQAVACHRPQPGPTATRPPVAPARRAARPWQALRRGILARSGGPGASALAAVSDARSPQAGAAPDPS